MTQYRKGFDDPKVHELFIKSVHDGDAEQVCAVIHGCDEMERLPVDALINSLPRGARINAAAARATSTADYPDFGSTRHTENIHQLIELAKMRDTPLVELSTDLPRGLRVVSPYLADVEVPEYTPGKDYGTTKAQHKRIQSGKDLAMFQGTGKATWITTGRDMAAYVHSDDPIQPWKRVVKDLLSQGIAPTMPDSMQVPFPAQASFIVYGNPFFDGLMGRALFEIGLVDFHTKWRDVLPRPEESAPVLTDAYLPLAYAEGSPMHPRGPAMHSGAAWVQVELIKHFWPDPMLKFVPLANELPDLHSETTIHDALDLLAHNIGYGRLHAGVHEEEDHLSAQAPAKVIIQELCRNL